MFHLDQLHDQVELSVCVHFFNQQNNVRMLNSPKNRHFVLDHVFLWATDKPRNITQWSSINILCDVRKHHMNCTHILCMKFRHWTGFRDILKSSNLPPAFALVNDLQSVLSACGSLHTLSDHGKVPIANHSSHFVPLSYGSRNLRIILHQLSYKEKDVGCNSLMKKMIKQ